jgi:hypothetical protein
LKNVACAEYRGYQAGCTEFSSDDCQPSIFEPTQRGIRLDIRNVSTVVPAILHA